MKVEALTGVTYNRVNYKIGQTFDHLAPEKAIELGLVKIVEDGEESEGSGVGGSDKKAKGKTRED
jgi:hypothetical protein